MSINVDNINDGSIEEFINDLDIRKDESNMYTPIDDELDELVAKGLVSEWRGQADKLLVFVNDNKWEDFKEASKELFNMDDGGINAIIQHNYICLELDPDEDFNV